MAEDSHVVLDLAAEADVDGQPSLLVLRLHVRVLGGQRVLHLQAGRHAGHLGVARVGQHLGQLHQEGGLGGGEEAHGESPTQARANYGPGVHTWTAKLFNPAIKLNSQQ